MKKKLHIHSDNAGWQGCENMPGIFLQDRILNKVFDISFSYRYSKEYEEGMVKWVDIKKVRLLPLKFWVSFLYKIRPYFKPIMLLKYLLMLEEIWKMFNLFKREKLDVLHINNGGFSGASSCNSAAIAGKLAGIKKITYMINSSAVNHWWEKPIIWMVKQSVDKFISASRHLRDESEFLRKIKYHHNLYDGKRFSDNWNIIPNTIKYKEPEDRNKLRERWGIKEDDIFILGLGNLEERKGFQLLPEVFRKIHDKNLNTVLRIIGTGKMALEIIGDISEYDMLETCKLHQGKDSDSYSIINACDIFILPSLYDEDFPNVLLIAMMYSKPCISTDLAGIPEIIDNWKTGVVVKPNDKIKLFNALDCLTFDDGYDDGKRLRKSFGKAGKEKFDKFYNNDVILNQYMDLWNK